MNTSPVCKHEQTTCPRCQRMFECKVGSINLCQCQAVRLTVAQQQYTSDSYQGCLCAACLLEIRSEYNQLIHQQTIKQYLHDR